MNKEDFNKIKYIHLRYSDMQSNEFCNLGGITIAYIHTILENTSSEDEENSVIDVVVEIAYTICSDNENFNKKVGRNIASNRLLNKAPQWYITEYYTTETLEDFYTYSRSDVLELCALTWPEIFSPWNFLNEN